VAAVLGSFGADTAAKVGEAANAKLQEFADDPVYTAGKAARKWGMVVLGGGVLALILGVVAKKLDQSYLNDITNTLGLEQQAPPTQGTPAAPSSPPPPPPIPPQVTLLNQIVADINSLGTTSASANVALLQDALRQLWNIANLVYAPQNTMPTQTPVTGSNPTGNANGLGAQLAIAIMQSCLLIQEFEGNTPTGVNWSGNNWAEKNVYGLDMAPDGSEPAYIFLFTQTLAATATFHEQGATDWGPIQVELSGVANPANFKQTINGIAYYLNMSQPFNITTLPAANFWGVLGIAAQDLSAVGAAIAGGAETVVNDVETFGKDVAQFAGDVGQALGFIGKVILNLPRLGFDALGFAFWWGVDMFANAVWLPLVIVGSVLVAFSVFALNVYPRIRTRLILTIKARGATFWVKVDNRWKSLTKAKAIRADKAKEVVLEAAIQEPAVLPKTVEVPTPAPPDIDAGLPAEAKQTEPEKVGEAVSPAVSQLSPEQPPGPAEPMGTPSPPAPVEPTPTETTEAMLGESGTNTPPPEPKLEPEPADTGPTNAELEEQERNRQESLPPSYRDKKRESERERSEKMLADLNEAFA
jgi:hypothetical protein